MADPNVPVPTKKNVIRRSRHTMAKLVLYSININGINSKLDSFLELLARLSPDIVTVCELKTNQLATLSVKLKELNYGIVSKRNSGIAIIAKLKLAIINTTASCHDNILSGSFTYHNIPTKVIVVYGLQENSPVSERENLFDELNVEVEHCSITGENPIIAGDLNAKIEEINGEICSTSSNGSFLLETIRKFDLQVLNFHEMCTGKWTRTIEKI